MAPSWADLSGAVVTGQGLLENVDSSERVFSMTLALMTMTMVMMMRFNCCLGSTWIERKSKDVNAMGKNKQLEGTSSSFRRSLFPASRGQRVNPMALVKGLGFLLWFRKIPWRSEWLPTPIFLPREFHGQRSLVGSKKKSDMTY